jgi:SAM-dependent methyltransferase
VISARLLSLVRCPECHGTLSQSPGALTCVRCGCAYGPASGDFLDLRPHVAFDERTKYLDEALHADARHERVSPPLLGSKIRNDMLRALLAPTSSDVVADLGCGSGRTLLWNRDWGSTNVGVDIAPFFSLDARQQVDLVIGDLRRLPFADATFTKAFSLDVLEHLSPDALRGMLREAARVIAPGGSLFVYTHVRKNARIAIGLRWVNALAGQLDRAGLIDLRQEHLRKSDHLNPLADIPELRRVAHETGFRIARIRYYTPIVGGFVENILVRMAERQMARRAASRLASAMDADAADRQALKEARSAAKARIAASGPTRAAFRALTMAMKLDLLLFGSIESGPFFALLERIEPRTSDLDSRASHLPPSPLRGFGATGASRASRP